MTPIIMPQIGQDIARGTIVAWLKKENDPVRNGEIILTVESEKASFDVEAGADGVLLKILFAEGEEAEVLKPVGYIGSPGEAIGPSDVAEADNPEAVASGKDRAERACPGSAARPRASPAARRVAGETEVPLDRVAGTGPGGRILKRDVLAAAGAGATGGGRAPSQAPDDDRRIPFSAMRRAIADRLSRASATIPHFHLFADADMENALRWREALAAAGGEHVTITDMVIRAAAVALRENPSLNCHVEAGAIVLRRRIHIGVVVASGDGLLVPVVRDADTLDIGALSRDVRRIVEQARVGKADPGPAATFTVTSLGMFGVRAFIPVIDPPQCAMLAVGAVEPRLVARDGAILTRRLLSLTLACDHRAVDGVPAARFLGRLKEVLERDMQ
jgi:pyruvate dehydrogenase E2 component (dihydrolipoamide acetyltransferase)